MPQTVPNRPMKGEAVATMARRAQPVLHPRALAGDDAVQHPVDALHQEGRLGVGSAGGPWRAPRAIRAAPPAACAAGRGAGRSPALVGDVLQARPESTSSSKRSASRFRAAKRNSLSMITVQDHSEARPRPTITTFTTQSARRNRATKLKALGVEARASGPCESRAPCDRRVGRGERRAVVKLWRRRLETSGAERARPCPAAAGAARPCQIDAGGLDLGRRRSASRRAVIRWLMHSRAPVARS